MTRPSSSLFFSSCRKSKTKPNGKKPPPEEKKQYLELEYTKIRVVDFDLKELVVLPREIDLNEWLASNSEYLQHGTKTAVLQAELRTVSENANRCCR